MVLFIPCDCVLQKLTPAGAIDCAYLLMLHQVFWNDVVANTTFFAQWRTTL
jgi:hypothetical protein